MAVTTLPGVVIPQLSVPQPGVVTPQLAGTFDCVQFYANLPRFSRLVFQYFVISCCCYSPLHYSWGYWCQSTDEGLATLPPRWIQEPLVVRHGDERLQEEPQQCIASVCSGSALLGDLLGVSRSIECDFPSDLS